MEDWFGTQGVGGIVDIVSSELDKMDKAHVERVENDIKAILSLIKDDRPDIVLKYMRYLKEDTKEVTTDEY